MLKNFKCFIAFSQIRAGRGRSLVSGKYSQIGAYRDSFVNISAIEKGPSSTISSRSSIRSHPSKKHLEPAIDLLAIIFQVLIRVLCSASNRTCSLSISMRIFCSFSIFSFRTLRFSLERLSAAGRTSFACERFASTSLILVRYSVRGLGGPISPGWVISSISRCLLRDWDDFERFIRFWDQ